MATSGAWQDPLAHPTEGKIGPLRGPRLASAVANPATDEGPESMSELGSIPELAHRTAAPQRAWAAARAAVSDAVDRRRRQLHRHLDAERRRRVADDLAHHVALDGGTGAGGRQYCRVPRGAACGRHRRRGGPPQAIALYPDLDGCRRGRTRRAHACGPDYANPALVVYAC